MDYASEIWNFTVSDNNNSLEIMPVSRVDLTYLLRNIAIWVFCFSFLGIFRFLYIL